MKRIVLSLGVLFMLAQNGYAKNLTKKEIAEYIIYKMSNIPSNKKFNKFNFSFNNDYCKVTLREEYNFDNERQYYFNVFNLKDISIVKIDTRNNEYWTGSGLLFYCKNEKKCINYYEKKNNINTQKTNEYKNTRAGSALMTHNLNSKIIIKLEKAFTDLVSKCSGYEELY